MDRTLEKSLTQLEALLVDQLQHHERMLELLDRKRVALRHANHAVVTDCSYQENQQLQKVSELEKQRLKIIADLTLMLDRDAKQPLTLMELAERMPEPTRGRLLVLRAQLRDRMQQVQKKTAVTRRATDTLVNHMQGLIQKVTAVCSGVSVYNATGAPPKKAMSVSTFSMTA